MERRHDFYRNVAAKLLQRYRDVRLEGEETKDVSPPTKGMDLTKFGMKASPECEQLTQKAQRRIARIVSP